jgi:hypothetical protein
MEDVPTILVNHVSVSSRFKQHCHYCEGPKKRSTVQRRPQPIVYPINSSTTTPAESARQQKIHHFVIAYCEVQNALLVVV